MSLQLFIAHCRSAVLDHNNLTVKFLNIGKRLDQYLCFFLRFVQTLIHHDICPFLKLRFPSSDTFPVRSGNPR